MSISDHHVFYWFTTPEELRAIAAEMEEMWPKCSPGQDKTVRVMTGKSAELRVLVDQENIKTPGWWETIQARRRDGICPECLGDPNHVKTQDVPWDKCATCGGTGKDPTRKTTEGARTYGEQIEGGKQ